MSFNSNLAFVLAHSILLESKGAEPLGQVWALNGGDPSADNVAETTLQQARAIERFLPRISNAIGNQMMPLAQAEQNVSQAISPQQQALQAELYAKYAPILNQVGQNISNSNARNQSAIDAEIMGGTGKQVAQMTAANQALLDPEFYKNRALIGNQIGSLVNGMGDPNSLSGGERAEVERSLNRDRLTAGNAGVNSGIGTVQNAMTFGSALQAKRNNFMGLLGGAAGANTALKSGQDAFSITSGRAAPTQFGAEQITGAQKGAGANTMNLGSNMLGQTGTAAQTQANINANRTTNLDNAMTIGGQAAGTY